MPVNLDVAILALGAAYLAYTAIVGQSDFRKMKGVEDTAQRQAFLRKWLIEGVLAGAAAFVALSLKGRLETLLRLPAEFRPAQLILNQPIVAIGFWILFGAFIALMLAPIYQVSRLPNSEKSAELARKLLNAQPLLARNGAESFWGALLSINAGINEELLFRLVLPLSVYALSGNLALAFAVPLIAFGVGHLYQGIGGVIATGIVGALMLGLYLATGSLLIAMAVHALIDLRGVVLIGWMLQAKARAAPAPA